MRRFLVLCPLFALVLAALAPADDTPKAAATRKKLDQKISVDYKDELLQTVITDLKDKVEGLGVRLDGKGGVSQNAKITFQAKDKPLAEVLKGICDKHDLGYYVISQIGNGYDGSLMLTRGKERGFESGKEPKEMVKADDKGKKADDKKTKTDDKKAKTDEKKAKTDEKPKVEEKKADEKPADDPEKLEAAAARRLKLAKDLLKDKQKDKAKDVFEDVIRRFPTTKAAKEAKELLKDLD